MNIAGRFHLTYCSNIHPGESWAEVLTNLQTYLPKVRDELGFKGRFGIGLRLSGIAARELEQPAELVRFKAFLESGNYYVFTINGFPYGVFHGQRVKEQVYLPDWLDPERLAYTNSLARILSEVVPEDLDLPASVSTVPGAFKTSVRSRDDELAIAGNMLRHVAFLKRLERTTGKRVTLAIEAEPRCFIETVDEMVRFFADCLLDESLLSSISAECAEPLTAESVRRYLGFCFDACHMAVEFEDPVDAIGRLKDAGISILKFQISSAVRLDFERGDSTAAKYLAPFAEDVYLHQVVERVGTGELSRYTDLPEALEAEVSAVGGEQVEWRVHFHVPIFLSEMVGMGTTQSYLTDLFDAIGVNPPSGCLEVETYTWDVLPEQYRGVDVSTAVARELRWVRDRIES